MYSFISEERALIWTAALLYLVAFVFGFYSLSQSKRYPRIILLTLVIVGFLFQTLGLYERGLKTSSCPLGNPFEIIQFITWTAILLYLVIGPAFRMSLLGFFSAGLAAGLGLLSLLIPEWDRAYETGPFGINPWIETHASMALFSYGIFATLALTSAMYLVQNYGLKQKRSKGMVSFLPSILQLDQMNKRLLFMAVVVFTFAISVGMVQWVDDFSQIQNTKLIFALAIWLSYLIVLILRVLNYLIGIKFAWTCVVLFTASLLTLWPIDASRSIVEESSSQQRP
jgi:ABC-type uncharacterized transport system permease subunit